MDLEDEYAKRIAEIYRFNSITENSPMNRDPSDIRKLEFEAMSDVFLGEDYCKKRLSKIEELQINVHQLQIEYKHQLDHGVISPSEYVSKFNESLNDTFNKCEQILGQKDFELLFGTSRDKLGGFIDKDIFLTSVIDADSYNPFADFSGRNWQEEIKDKKSA